MGTAHVTGLPTPISWSGGGAVRLLDQTQLPGVERYREVRSAGAMAEAIVRLRVRGAPLIGIAGAMGLTLALRGKARPSDRALALVRDARRDLEATRPTAVNLRWALARTEAAAIRAAAAGEDVYHAMVAEADAIWAEDRAMCERIGAAGAALLPDGAVVLTHCNAGALATGGIGTALAPVYVAHRAGRGVSVVADETRPLLQGSRLTAWELTRAGVPCTVIADGMAAARLARGDVSCVIVGADRVAANGDVANKIGTYGLALVARARGVPFYVAAPRSTIDPATPDGAAIPIEHRATDELAAWRGRPVAPAAAAVWNPAFDVTPAALVTGYVTDAGLLTAQQLAELREVAGER